MTKKAQNQTHVELLTDPAQKGTAIVIALLIMVLLMGFVALAISRTNSETISAANDASESKAFDASHASLEVMTRNFNKIFDTKLNPDAADLTHVESLVPPGFDNYTFTQRVQKTDDTESVVMTEGQFQGLTALRDGWRLDATAEETINGVEVSLSRRFYNNRIPIFQFGIFYDDDLEFHPGPRFDFGGRVHSNGSLFLAANTRLNFSSKVTARDHIFTDVQKNNTPWSNWGDQVYIKDASGVFRRLANNQGSVLQNPANGPVVSTNPNPTAYANADWPTQQARFQGNLLSNQKELKLPLKLNSDINNLQLDLIELVKRSKRVGDLWNDGTGSPTSPNIVAVTAANADDLVTSSERYANKTGIRVHLADSKAKLPGCAAAMGPCGVRLDGDAAGQGTGNPAGARGYQPRPMTGSGTYQATRLNGDRFRIDGRQVWIKIETVQYNATTQVHEYVDITEDILSLGVTEQAPSGLILDANYTTGSGGTDGRSILKLQRFAIRGANIPQPTLNRYITVNTSNNTNYVVPGTVPTGQDCSSVTPDPRNIEPYNANGINFDGSVLAQQAHMKTASPAPLGISGVNGCVVPFPIKMFDTREGLWNDTTAVFNPTAAGNYSNNRVPWAGVMSLVDIDIENLRRFMDGNFDGGGGPALATGTPFASANGRPLRSTDIPNANGIVLYVSDRRGDFDFDGQYDMEDVYGPNDGILQPGEDSNKNGTLQTDYDNEAPRYTGANSNEAADIAAVLDHKFYRRGIRLINGTLLPGRYDSANPAETRGFTVASENGVYVLGNYNATGVTSFGTPTPSTDYVPHNTVDHVPASIAADAITILSNNWQDARSFTHAFNLGSRPATMTTIRFAMLTGDTLSSLNATPNQGGGDPRMSGGVHNFKRFLEAWAGVRVNYSGSIINLFNSQNNSAPFKCCTRVYGAPDRNWVFDTTFLNINRIPPGTPFFQSIQITGFERKN